MVVVDEHLLVQLIKFVACPKESGHEVSLISFCLYEIAGCLTGCH